MGNSLALCMIVKNEEHFLPYCLGSVYKYCDEIIIVDTGSTDKTISIAKAFGAYVIQAPWKNDFALVRNISQSCAHSDWIMWLDSDEVLSQNGIEKVKNQLLFDNSADFFLLPRVNFWKSLKHMFAYPDSQYKIYRNNIGLKWTGKLHEKIYDDTNSDHRRKLRHSDVHIFHYAYTKEKEDVKKKMQLYIHVENPDMDLRMVEKCSTDHSYFFDKNPQEVQDYNGPLPEIFDRLAVTNDEIKIDGTSFKIINETTISQTPQQDFKVENELIKNMCSIVIVTHNKVEYLAPLIRGIYQSTHISFEIIIIDNGSTEMNVMEFLIDSEKKNNNFKFIHLDKNESFAKSYNIGLKHVKGEWVCILNNDVLVTNLWLDKMIEHLKENKDIGIIAPVSNNIYGEHQMLNAPPNSTFGDYLSIMEKLTQEQKTTVYSSWTTACCWVFHRDVIQNLSKVVSPPKNGYFFDEAFPIGMSEDTDINFYVQHRLQKKMAVARDVFVWHYGSKTLNSLQSLNVEELQKNNNLILRKKWPDIFNA